MPIMPNVTTGLQYCLSNTRQLQKWIGEKTFLGGAANFLLTALTLRISTFVGALFHAVNTVTGLTLFCIYMCCEKQLAKKYGEWAQRSFCMYAQDAIALALFSIPFLGLVFQGAMAGANVWRAHWGDDRVVAFLQELTATVKKHQADKPA